LFVQEEVPSPVLPDEDLIAVLTAKALTPGLRSKTLSPCLGSRVLTDKIGVFQRTTVALSLLFDAAEQGTANAFKAGWAGDSGGSAEGHTVVGRVRINDRPCGDAKHV